MNPANRNSNSQEMNIGITSSLRLGHDSGLTVINCHSIPRRRCTTSRKGKKNLRSRLREATATVWLSTGTFRNQEHYITFFVVGQYRIDENSMIIYLLHCK